MRVIYNLHVAEKEERDAFWRSVVDKFPENRKLRTARLEWRLSGGFARLSALRVYRVTEFRRITAGNVLAEIRALRELRLVVVSKRSARISCQFGTPILPFPGTANYALVFFQ